MVDRADDDEGGTAADDGSASEGQGVVWIEFCPQGGAAVSYPMAGVPRVGETVDLAGPMAMTDAWVVTGVVWVVPFAARREELLAVSLGELPAVRVYLDRAKTR